MKVARTALLAGAVAVAIGTPAVAADGDKPAPDLTAGRDLLPGTKCKKAAMPAWTLGADQRTAQITGAPYRVTVPPGFTARLERPDLVVVTAAQSADGVRPTFELFVSPLCKSYDAPKVSQRLAARGLSGLLPPPATAAQVAKGRWSGGLGGPVGVSLILYDVEVKTDKGARKLVLYVTDTGSTKTFGIHGAAVCPSPGSPAKTGPCEESYFALLQSATGAKSK
jgi:hypothetical protein